MLLIPLLLLIKLPLKLLLLLLEGLPLLLSLHKRP
jgi:hypothetical protein